MDGSSGTSPRAYPSPASTPKRFLTHDQVQALAGPCAPYDTLIRVLAYAGLRWGELVALTACRIDLARRRIEVVEAITDVHGRVVIGTTKTHQRRSVPIPRFLADELADHLAGKAPGDLVLTPHELRHTAASLAIAAGANVKGVQLMLGHASAAMTLDIYAGPLRR